MSDVIDLDSLLSPIEGDAPNGTDLRQDYSAQAPLRLLRDARNAAREAERRAETPVHENDPDYQEHVNVRPDWGAVQHSASDILRTTSKDIEVACWMTEALVRNGGFAGLAAGAALIAGLAERFWDGLFPAPDEDEPNEEPAIARTRPVSALGGSSGTLIQPLRKLPLLQMADGSSFGYGQYEQSVALAGIDATRREQRLAAGVRAWEDVLHEAQATDRGEIAARRGDVAAALEQWNAMSAALDRLAGAKGPSTGPVRDLLVGILRMLDQAGAGGPPAAAAVDDGSSKTSTEPSSSAAGPAGGGALASREDALRSLARVAEFFRRTEPHSPLAYTLDEAVRRGRMSWPELLAEIVPEAGTRNAILSSLGIRPPAEEQ